jgi:hypothetical protein
MNLRNLKGNGKFEIADSSDSESEDVGETEDTLSDPPVGESEDPKPLVGAPIMVTVTARNGEIGKFIGTYAPENDEFVLRPLPGKRYIQQFPMFPNQQLGWDYAVKPKDKEEVDPDQIRIDVWGEDRMVFPGGHLFDPFTGTHNPTLLTDTFTWEPLENIVIPANKTPDAIKAKVRDDPSSLKKMTLNDGLTAEVLIDLMNENGTWLSHLQDEFKTLEICLAAARQTLDAFSLISSDIINDYPIFYKIAIDHDPLLIASIPPSKLTEDLIARALAKNPNISQVPSIKAILHPDKHTPTLNRQISYTQTDQGNQGTCGRHAFSRVIVKNFFDLILPFQTHPDQEMDCNRFLDTVNLEQPGVIDGLTPQKCSFNGYLKTLLFLHCFFLYQYYAPCTTGGLEPLQASHIYPHLYIIIRIPHITHDQKYDLTDALTVLQNAQKKYHISLITFHFRGTDLTFENIKKITDKGLYVKLGLQGRSITGVHANHAVIIVGAKDGFIKIKNSWNDKVVYDFKIGSPFLLGSYSYDNLDNCAFVIPVEHSKNEVFQDLTYLDVCLHKYDELKTRFNRITATVMNKSCPSKNKEPVKCDEVNTFSKQLEVFFPWYNPRCREEAEAKYEKLKELCNPSNPKRLLLTYGGKSKGKRKTRRKRTRRAHKIIN